MAPEVSGEPSAEMAEIIQSAARLGIELDEAEALQWLTAMAAAEAQEGVVVDERTGVFGHRMVMLDFSDQDLAHFREIGRLEDPELSRGCRLLRARQHHRPHSRGSLRDSRAHHAREGAEQAGRASIPAH